MAGSAWRSRSCSRCCGCRRRTMKPDDAAARLEAILRAENEALARHDAVAATSMLDEKLAAAKALSASGISLEDGERLRTLAAENRRLLERAIQVQGRIVAMV